MRQNIALYADHNATAPLRPAVAEAMSAADREAWANPSSPHAAGRAAAALLESARRRVAAVLDADPRWITFTSGATEANAQALAPGAGPPVWAAAVEHPSVLEWAEARLAVDSDGVLDLEAFLGALHARPAGAPGRLRIALQLANNETGVLQPIDAVLHATRAGGHHLHCDATQAPGRLPLRGLAARADSLALSAHKAGGPKGVGLLIAKTPPSALLRGGPQERGLRAGTVPVSLVAGLACALELAEAEAAAGQGAADPGPRDQLEAALCRLGARPLASGRPRLPNTCAALLSVPAELAVAALDLAGLSASTGAACSSGASSPSHVLLAMGLRGRPLRLSLGPGIDVQQMIVLLERTLPALTVDALDLG
jgi:cysteine desulfurase